MFGDQILYGVDTSYVDRSLKYQKDGSSKSLDEIKEETDSILNRLTGDREYRNFGPYINDALQKLHPDAGFAVTGANIGNWTSYDFDHDPILPNGIKPGFTVEVDRKLSDKQRNMLVDAVNDHITEMFPDIYEPVGTKADTRTLSARMHFGEIWDPHKVNQYFEAKDKAEQEEKAFLASLEPPVPYPGKKYIAELPFTFAVPVKDAAETEAKLNEVPIKDKLNQQLKYSSKWDKPRVIIGTNVTMESEREGNIRIELTKPIKECGAAWLNTVKYQFAKDGLMSQCVKENDLVDMKSIKKGKVFESVGNKVVAVDDFQDFADAVSRISEDNGLSQ